MYDILPLCTSFNLKLIMNVIFLISRSALITCCVGNGNTAQKNKKTLSKEVPQMLTFVYVPKQSVLTFTYNIITQSII